MPQPIPEKNSKYLIVLPSENYGEDLRYINSDKELKKFIKKHKLSFEDDSEKVLNTLKEEGYVDAENPKGEIVEITTNEE